MTKSTMAFTAAGAVIFTMAVAVNLAQTTNDPSSEVFGISPVPGQTNDFIIRSGPSRPELVDTGSNWLIHLVPKDAPPPPPTVLKAVADAQAGMARQQGYAQGFADGVRAAEQARLEEALPALTQRAIRMARPGGQP